METIKGQKANHIINIASTYAGRINDPSGANAALFRTQDDNNTLADYILFDQYQPGRYLQLQKTSGKFRIAEIEMTFADMCK